jgi:hypothetical protein
MWALVLLPALLLALTLGVEWVQSVTEGDVDVQRALEQAVKAAAMQVTPESQAAGRPRIHTARALAAFERMLAANLGLDPTALTPLAGSALKERPDFVLVVYNGDAAFAAGGAQAAWKYRYSGGVLTGGPVAAAGFPCRFGVTSSDVLPGGGGTISVTLDMLGCVGVVSAKGRNVLGRTPLAPVRYAAARIVCPSGACGV